MDITKEEFEQQARDIKEIKEILQVLLNTGITNPVNKEFIGITEAAKLTNLSVSTIYNLRNLEKIPYHKRTGSKKLLFSTSELNSWMSNKKVTNTVTRKKILEL